MNIHDLQRAAWEGAEAQGFHESLRDGQPFTMRYKALDVLASLHHSLDVVTQAVKRHGITDQTLEAAKDILRVVQWEGGLLLACWDREESAANDTTIDTATATRIRLALVSTEVSEALTVSECGREKELGHELADILVRVADLAEDRGIDLNSATEYVVATNRRRPYKYGTPDAQEGATNNAADTQEILARLTRLPTAGEKSSASSSSTDT